MSECFFMASAKLQALLVYCFLRLLVLLLRALVIVLEPILGMQLQSRLRSLLVPRLGPWEMLFCQYLFQSELRFWWKVLAPLSLSSCSPVKQFSGEISAAVVNAHHVNERGELIRQSYQEHSSPIIESRIQAHADETLVDSGPLPCP